MGKTTPAQKNPVGRPRLFQSPEELQSKVDEYFETNEKFAVGKLGYYLGFASRQSLQDYLDQKDKFSYIVLRAKYFIEGEYELLLQANNVAGIIFALKNMGWKDRTEVDQNIMASVTMSDIEIDGKPMGINIGNEPRINTNLQAD